MILDQEVGKWRSAAAVWVAPDGSAIKTEETDYGLVCDWPLMLFLHQQETFF